MAFQKRCVYRGCASLSRARPPFRTPGVFFIPFAKPRYDVHKALRWVEACDNDRLTIDEIKKWTYICSKHFVGGNGPTNEHPDPIPYVQMRLLNQQQSTSQQSSTLQSTASSTSSTSSTSKSSGTAIHPIHMGLGLIPKPPDDQSTNLTEVTLPNATSLAMLHASQQNTTPTTTIATPMSLVTSNQIVLPIPLPMNQAMNLSAGKTMESPEPIIITTENLSDMSDNEDGDGDAANNLSIISAEKSDSTDNNNTITAVKTEDSNSNSATTTDKTATTSTTATTTTPTTTTTAASNNNNNSDSDAICDVATAGTVPITTTTSTATKTPFSSIIAPSKQPPPLSGAPPTAGVGGVGVASLGGVGALSGVSLLTGGGAVGTGGGASAVVLEKLANSMRNKNPQLKRIVGVQLGTTPPPPGASVSLLTSAVVTTTTTTLTRNHLAAATAAAAAAAAAAAGGGHRIIAPAPMAALQPQDTNSTTTRAINITPSTEGKSVPIHCIIEKSKQASTAGSSRPSDLIDLDTYAILPSATLFSEAVRTALQKLGYSTTEANSAKGTIHIKNWKPLSFDTITDNTDATLEEVLGDLTSVATLRIKLCSRSRFTALDDIKDKLLQFLLRNSNNVLAASGFPLQKSIITQLTMGEQLPITEEFQSAFDKWYKDQTGAGDKPLEPIPVATSLPGAALAGVSTSVPALQVPGTVLATSVNSAAVLNAALGLTFDPTKLAKVHSLNNNTLSTTPLMVSAGITAGSLVSTPAGALAVGAKAGGAAVAKTVSVTSTAQLPKPQSSIAQSYPALRNELNSGLYKTRIRTSFDPETEIPRLHAWFALNSHPNREQMVSYLTELNNLDTRIGKKPLDLTNIIYWFKNARAAQRRAFKRDGPPAPAGATNGTSDRPNESAVVDSNGETVVVHMMDMDTSEADLSDERLSPTPDEPATPPELPNRNAVYMMANPASALPGVNEDSPIISIYPQDPQEDEDDDDMDSTNGDGELQIDESTSGTAENGYASGADESSNSGSKKRKSTAMTNGAVGDESDLMKDDYVVLSEKKAKKLSKPSDASSDIVKIEPESSDEDKTDNKDGIASSANNNNTSKVRPILPASQTHVALASAINAPLSMHYLNPMAHALYGLTPPTQALATTTTSTPVSTTPQMSPFSDTNSSPGMDISDRKKRSRVFIDPLSEIPKLEQWFQEDTHPSSYMIEKYTHELNELDYRKRFPPLEAKNVQLWFKNHRAKVKRARFEGQGAMFAGSGNS